MATGPSLAKFHGSQIVTWTLGDDESSGPYLPPSGFDLESVQITGTVDGDITLEGSNDVTSTTWAALATAVSAVGFVFPSGQAHQYRVSSAAGTTGDSTIRALFRSRN